VSAVKAKVTDDVGEEDNIVIVGARIAGVATAVSLQRLHPRPNSQQHARMCWTNCFY
jgi:hypothetical protein